MIVSAKNLGERLRTENGLEIVVFELTATQIKLGVCLSHDGRAQAAASRTVALLPPSRRPGSYGYFYSRGGSRMFVLSGTVGERLPINDCVGLSIESVAPDAVRVSTVTLDGHSAPVRSRRRPSELTPTVQKQHNTSPQQRPTRLAYRSLPATGTAPDIPNVHGR